MSDAILLFREGAWCYAAVDSDVGMAALRSVSIGLSSPCGHFIRLGSHVSFPATGLDGLKIALSAMDGDELRLMPNEKLCFGNKKGSFSYDRESDLCLSECPVQVGTIGVRLRPRDLDDEEIVMTLWPSSRRAMPAKARRIGKRVWLDLVEEQNKGDRCFVFDDGWNGLITASLPVSEGQVEAVSHCSIGTWLCSAGSKSASWMSDRFGVDGEGGSFVVEDRKTGRKYRGRFHAETAGAQAMEKAIVERRLAAKGIGALIPTYRLAKA